MQAAKLALRKEIKSRLKLMTSEERIKQSQAVVSQLLNHEAYKKSQRISVYLSMKTEVQTHAILEHALKNQKKVYIPKYVGNNMDMVLLKSMQDYNDMPETSWHIKQPPDDEVGRDNAMESGGLDLIVVPGVGFTVTGDRLGHGKGYYDSYIEKISAQKKPRLIGLAYKQQICPEIPTHDHDKTLDVVLTFNE